MVTTADAVVIGGGILGASVAHFLTKTGFGDVVLVEKGDLCSGSTRYSAGHVRQHYSNEVTIRLAVRAVDMFEHSDEELGGQTGFIQCGYMVIAPQEDADAIRNVIPLQQALGVGTEILSVSDIQERFPILDTESVAIAAYERRSGYADPALTVRAIARSAEPWGLRIHERTEVTDIDVSEGRVASVRTGHGTISTRTVVNCAGPWGARVGTMVGMEHDLTLSREHEAIFRVPIELRELPVISDAGNRLYFRPDGEGRLLVGEGYPKDREPCDPDAYDRGADDETVSRMALKASTRLPMLAAALGPGGYREALITGSSGVYDITPDWNPIVGASGPDGYFSAIGGSGHCFKIGPPIGEALADVIAGNQPAIDISPLSGDRFEAGKSFSSVWGPGNRA